MSLQDLSPRVAYGQLNSIDFAMSLEDVSLHVAARQQFNFIDFFMDLEGVSLRLLCVQFAFSNASICLQDVSLRATYEQLDSSTSR